MTIERFNPEVIDNCGEDEFAEMVRTPDGAWVRYESLQRMQHALLALYDHSINLVTAAAHEHDRVLHASVLRQMIVDLGIAERGREWYTEGEKNRLFHFGRRFALILALAFICGLLVGRMIWRSA